MDTATTGHVLSDEDHQHLLEHGFLLLKGAIPRNVAERTIATVHEHGPTSEAGRQALSECVTPAIHSAVDEICGPGRAEQRGDPIYRPRPHTPDLPEAKGSHCDLIYPTVLPESWVLSAFMFLSRVEPGGGGIMYAPGSPNALKAFAAANSPEAAWARCVAFNNELVECLAEPGDILLFPHFMAHSSSTNRTGPQREAADMRFILRERLIPSATRPEEMTTIDRMNSLQALRERGIEVDFPAPVPDAAGVLADGYGRGVVAQDTIRIDGRVHIFRVEAADPTTILRSSTADWATFTDHEPIRLAEAPVDALHIDNRFGLTITVLSGGEASTWKQTDGAWERVRGLEARAVGRPHFVHENQGVQDVRGTATFSVPTDRPNEVHWRSGEDRKDTEPPESGVALALPEGARIDDVLVRPALDTVRAAIALDVDGAAAPLIATSEHADRYPDEARRLRGASGVSRIRVHDRARDYWLVTYLRNGRVLWGSIDGLEAEPTLHEIRTPENMQQALAVIGLA